MGTPHPSCQKVAPSIHVPRLELQPFEGVTSAICVIEGYSLVHLGKRATCLSRHARTPANIYLSGKSGAVVGSEYQATPKLPQLLDIPLCSSEVDLRGAHSKQCIDYVVSSPNEVKECVGKFERI